jgi:NADH:ubiquinone oxidoreductase subunit 3 (subunit A)
MDTKMNLAMKTLIVSFLFISVLGALSSVYEIYSITVDEENYQRFYGLIKSSEHWQFQSVRNFVMWQLMWCLFYVGIIVIGLRSLNTNRINIAFSIAIVLMSVLMIRYFYLWKESGFDHYPGFDPYIF